MTGEDGGADGGPGRGTDRGALNLAWARAFVDELARAGVREACVAPGSRSTPLVLALAREERIRISVHLDERCAGFFALGVGKASDRPAAVVTTSGTATANLFPAVVEAGSSGTPLLLLTADRPARLRGADANQTVDQTRMYGSHVRLFHDVGPPEADRRAFRYVRALAARAVGAALGRPGGPVHLNFPFDKPLQPPPEARAARAGELADLAAAGRPDGAPWTRVGPSRAGLDDGALARLSGRMSGSGRGLIVCGPATEPDRLGPAALALARSAGWPLLADPLSGARFGEGAAEWSVAAYDLFLRSPDVRERLAPDLVLRLGGAPTSSSARAFLEDLADARQVVLDDGDRWPDHRAVACEVHRVDPASAARALADGLAGTGAGGPGAWLEAWREAAGAARAVAAAGAEEEPFEGTVLDLVARTAPAGGVLFAGSSMPVRDLDAFGAPREEPLTVIGNRGASGIDGSVSTALGAAAASGAPTVAVLGDLALYHDMNGLRAARAMDLPVVFVVIHNDGGGIFHMLPIREHEPAFTPYFATPHGLDFRHAADMYGIPYRRMGEEGRPPGADDLESALREALDAAAPRILEVRSDREANRRRHREVAGAAVAAAEEALGDGRDPGSPGGSGGSGG